MTDLLDTLMMLGVYLSAALTDSGKISKIYNNHSGDKGVVGDFTAPVITDDNNILYST